jgi:cytochrome P450
MLALVRAVPHREWARAQSAILTTNRRADFDSNFGKSTRKNTALLRMAVGGCAKVAISRFCSSERSRVLMTVGNHGGDSTASRHERCPVVGAATSEYNPMMPPHRDDPYPYYRLARMDHSVSYNALLGMWVITRYEDIKSALSDSAHYSSRCAVPGLAQNPPDVLRILEKGVPEGRLLIQQDPPKHSNYRNVVNRAFAGHRINALRPQMRAVADKLIEELIGEGAADLVAQFADEYICQVSAIALGAPVGDAARIRKWDADVFVLLDATAEIDAKKRAAAGFIEYQRYFVDLINERRSEPRDDLLSALICAAEQADIPLPFVDLVTQCWEFFTAGLHTPRDALTSAILNMLADDRQYWEQACKEPDKISVIVEETLRRNGPLKGVSRETTDPVELGGATLPAGATLFLLLGSGNRDEREFHEPDRFEPMRSDVRKHLSFGSGIHLCPGANLARSEIRVALTALTENIPEMTLAEQFTPSYVPAFFFHGLERLDVVWSGRAR